MKQRSEQFDSGVNNASIEEEAHKERRWAVLSLCLAALTIWGVTSQWKDFSLSAFLEDLSQADKRWMIPAVASMLGFIVFEGCAIRCACRALKYPVRLNDACSYAAADIYFSSITPSATGGQPACALLMRRGGIPLMVSTAVLMLTLAMYALAMLVIGFAGYLLFPRVFRVFGTPSRILIVAGFAGQILLALLFSMLLWREKLLEKLALGLFDLLVRLHLMPHAERRRARLEKLTEDYRQYASLLAGQRALLLRSFLFNLLQRVSQLAVTVFCFLALGGQPRMVGEIFAMQSYVVIGSYCVPLPGGMGVADYLLLDGVEEFLPPDLVVSMELLSRSLSFYVCVLLCGLLVFFRIYRHRAK